MVANSSQVPADKTSLVITKEKSDTRIPDKVLDPKQFIFDAQVIHKLDTQMTYLLPILDKELKLNHRGLLNFQGREALKGLINIVTNDEIFADGIINLIEADSFKLMSKKSQMTSKATENGKFEISKRYEHSIHAVQMFCKYATNIGLSEHQIKIGVLILAVHDIGHAPFSHAFEDAINSRKNETFCHDDFGAELIKSSPISTLIKRCTSHLKKEEQISARLISNIVKEEQESEVDLRLYIEIKDIFDRASYIIQDIERSCFQNEDKARCVNTIEKILSGFYYNKDEESLVLKDENPEKLAVEFIELRQRVFREISQQPATTIVNKLININVSDFIKRTNLPVKAIQAMTEDEVINGFNSPVGFKYVYTQKVETCFEPILTIPLSKLNNDGVNIFNSQEGNMDFITEMQKSLQQKFPNRPINASFLKESLIGTQTKEYGKEWETLIEKNGEIQNHKVTQFKEVSTNDRFVIIALRINSDYFNQEEIAFIKKTSKSYMARFITPNIQRANVDQFDELTKNTFKLYVKDDSGRLILPEDFLQ